MRPTKSFQGVHTAKQFRTLSTSFAVHEIADRAREAGLAFLARARAPWGRLGLGSWLLHAYSTATIPPTTTVVELRPRPVADALSGDTATVEALVCETRRYVVERLRGCTRSWQAAGFARDMVESGLVVGVRDEIGAIGYAPVDDRGMRLGDRVASLFVADYLTRPRDYASLIVCASCEEVSFDWAEVHSRGCDRARNSGVVRSDQKRATYRGLG